MLKVRVFEMNEKKIYIIAVENGRRDEWSGLFPGSQVQRVIKSLVARGILRGKRRLVVEPV